MVDCQQNPGTIQEVGLGLTPGLFSMAFQTGGTRPRGSEPHRGAPALGGLRLLPVHGVGAPTFAPLTLRRKRKKAVRVPHPDSTLSPQRPRTATAAGSTASALLPGLNPETHSSRYLAFYSPETQFQPRGRGGGGAVLGVELRTSKGTWAPRLSPPVLQSLDLRCSARAPSPRLGQYPQARWRQR